MSLVFTPIDIGIDIVSYIPIVYCIDIASYLRFYASGIGIVSRIVKPLRSTPLFTTFLLVRWLSRVASQSFIDQHYDYFASSIASRIVKVHWSTLFIMSIYFACGIGIASRVVLMPFSYIFIRKYWVNKICNFLNSGRGCLSLVTYYTYSSWI